MDRTITTVIDNKTFKVDADGARIGVIHLAGCANSTCKAAIRDGRAFHAIPMFGTLDTYHFATKEEAVAALVERAEHPDPDLVKIMEDYLAVATTPPWAGQVEAVEYAKQRLAQA
jgi:hypothetical protein